MRGTVTGTGHGLYPSSERTDTVWGADVYETVKTKYLNCVILFQRTLDKVEVHVDLFLWEDFLGHVRYQRMKGAN